MPPSSCRSVLWDRPRRRCHQKTRSDHLARRHRISRTGRRSESVFVWGIVQPKILRSSATAGMDRHPRCFRQGTQSPRNLRVKKSSVLAGYCIFPLPGRSSIFALIFFPQRQRCTCLWERLPAAHRLRIGTKKTCHCVCTFLPQRPFRLHDYWSRKPVGSTGATLVRWMYGATAPPKKIPFAS